MGVVVRVINLDRTRDRLASFRAANPELPIERVRAVDGKLISRDACIRFGLISAANRYAAGPIGNAASHIRLWQECAAGNEPFHIAEDDALFHRDFVSWAAGLLGALGEWDAVFWGFNFDWPVQAVLPPAADPMVIQFDQTIMRAKLDQYRVYSCRPILGRLQSCAGTLAYSISPGGAQRYLARCLPIGDTPARLVIRPGALWSNTGLDVEMSRHHGDLATYVAMPPLAYSPNDPAISTAR